MAIALDVIENLAGRDQEALFARDEDGQLIRKVAATREMFRKTVWVVIDGIPIEMPAAVPVTDALGNVKNGPDGLPIPRASTIYDAAVKLTQQGIWTREDLETRIPVLCHAQHLAPVAVCRVCSVHVSKRRKRDGKLAPSEKLVPACQHEVQADMVVTSREGAYPGWDTYYRTYAKDQKKKDLAEGEKKRKKDHEAKNPDGPAFVGKTEAELDAEAKKAADEGVAAMKVSLRQNSPTVRRAVNVLSEFLLTDHYRPDPKRDDRFRNELEDLARTTGHLAKRMPSMPDMDLDEDGFDMAIPESLSRQMIDISAPSMEFDALRSGPQFRGKLDLPPPPADRANRNLPAQSHPKSRPLSLPIILPAPDPEDVRDDPEWVRRDEADYGRFPYSSRTILVDHDRCILCDRCVRSCSEVKPFKIIGHTGKGYTTRVSFDLDKLMNESNCVQCGECMTACPTGALTLKRRVAPRAFADVPKIPKDPNDPLPKTGTGSELLTAAEMTKVVAKYRDEGNRVRKFRPFRTIPFSYLRWNEGAVRRRAVQAGEVLCVQGEYGRTAFFLETGEYEVLFNPALSAAPAPGGFFARLLGKKAAVRTNTSDLGNVVGTAGAEDTIVGELACLTARPRGASIRAKTAGVVYEVTRNLLDMAQRSPAARDPLGLVYLRNAVRSALRQGELVKNLSDELRTKVIRFLADKEKGKDGGPGVPRSELRRLEPGQVIVSQGDPASDFYIVRLGTVKIGTIVRGREWVVGKMSSDDYFGHVALLVNELAKDERVAHLLSPDELAGRRTATVTALDPVEVVRISGDAFRKLMANLPDLRRQLLEDAVRLLKRRETPPPPVQENRLADFLNQGLYQGQKMLVLDLDTCTRCDECTRACADSHGDGQSRLLREGMRFGQFLVAASCRSCEKPYCMDGCPVDAIHRAERSLEVMIDNHCIGCSLCEKNCPFGSIQMVEQGNSTGPRKAATVQRAVNCDLCHDLISPGDETFCVSACPHEAAFRWDAGQLAAVVAGTKDHYGKERKAKPVENGVKPPVVNP